MINDLPTVFEVAVGKVKKEGKKKPPVSNHSNSKSKSNSKVYKLRKQTVSSCFADGIAF